MALDDTLRQQIIYDLQVRGISALTDWQAHQATLSSDLGVFKAQLAAGTITGQQFQAMSRDVTKELQTSTQAVTYATSAIKNLDAAQKALDTTMAKAATGANRFGMAAVELSRGLEDLAVAGPLGALNNTARFAEIMGGPGGVAAGVSLAATAAYLLYKNWDLVNEVLGTGATKTEAERMEELGRKTHKTVEEQREFNRLKKEEMELEKLRNLRPEEERKTSKEVEAAFAEAGGSTPIAEALLAGRLKSGTAAIDPKLTEVRNQINMFADAIERGRKVEPTDPRFAETQASIKDAEKIVMVLRQEEEKLAKEWKDLETQRAEEDVRGALTDPLKLERLIKETERNAPLFPKGLAGRLMEARPEDRAAQEALEAEGRQQGREQVKHGHELERARAAAAREKEREAKAIEVADERNRVYTMTQKEKAERAREVHLDRLAGHFRAGVGAEAHGPILSRLQKGMPVDQITGELEPQIARVLRNTPGFPAGDEDAVSKRIAAKALEEVQAKIAGAMAGGPDTATGAAAGVLGQEMTKDMRKGRQEATQQGKDARRAAEFQLAENIGGGQTMTPKAALDVAHRTLAMNDQGLSFDKALLLGFSQVANRLSMQERKAAMLNAELMRVLSNNRVMRPSTLGDFQ